MAAEARAAGHPRFTALPTRIWPRPTVDVAIRRTLRRGDASRQQRMINGIGHGSGSHGKYRLEAAARPPLSPRTAGPEKSSCETGLRRVLQRAHDERDRRRRP